MELASQTSTRLQAKGTRDLQYASSRGLIKGGAWNKLAHVPSLCAPSTRLIFNLNNHEFTSRVDVLKSGDIQWIAGGRSHGWISLSGIAFPAKTAQRSNVPLVAGWKPYGGDYGTPTYTVRDGLCSIEGLVRHSSWSASIATLPSECRPNKRLIFNLNIHQYTARVDVATNGAVTWHAGGNSNEHKWISLTGIHFATRGAKSRELTLSGGAQPYGSVYGSPSYAIADGACVVEGLIRIGNNTMARLPAACRPKKRLIFNVNNHQFTSRVDVLPDGYIAWTGGGRHHGWISVSGILFHCGV